MSAIIPVVSLGENAVIDIGGALLNVQSGTVVENPQEIGTGSNRTGGFTTRTRGLFNLEISFKGQWTLAQNPFTNPPALQPGAEVGTYVRIYQDQLNEPDAFYDLPDAWCVQATCELDSNPQGGVISYSVQIKNQGEYGTPAYPIV